MLYIALPVLDESGSVPALLECIFQQDLQNFKLVVCVNQPDEWWNLPEKHSMCEHNRLTLDYLERLKDPRVVVIDRSSPGKGFRGKRHGVGWARKTAMDRIDEMANPDDLILSLDADTVFSSSYFRSVEESFNRYPEAVGMSVPYFHNPVSDERAYRAILRYEIYMRHYALNLWRTGTPFTFTALGSAMACRVNAYRAIGGMTPKMSGEDFYFLQKLRKYGPLLAWNPEKVFPAARFSDRVYFGTGPAMIKGDAGDWSSYPLYPFRFFDEVGETIRLFPDFFDNTTETPVVNFLRDIFREKDPFQPLRVNATTPSRFVRACHEKFDGLRILQYVKARQREVPLADEYNLTDFLDHRYPGWRELMGLDSFALDFATTDLRFLEKIRSFLVDKEDEVLSTRVLS